MLPPISLKFSRTFDTQSTPISKSQLALRFGTTLRIPESVDSSVWFRDVENDPAKVAASKRSWDAVARGLKAALDNDPVTRLILCVPAFRHMQVTFFHNFEKIWKQPECFEADTLDRDDLECYSKGPDGSNFVLLPGDNTYRGRLRKLTTMPTDNQSAWSAWGKSLEADMPFMSHSVMGRIIFPNPKEPSRVALLDKDLAKWPIRGLTTQGFETLNGLDDWSYEIDSLRKYMDDDKQLRAIFSLPGLSDVKIQLAAAGEVTIPVPGSEKDSRFWVVKSFRFALVLPDGTTLPHEGRVYFPTNHYNLRDLDDSQHPHITNGHEAIKKALAEYAFSHGLIQPEDDVKIERFTPEKRS
ncbi:MAG: hypothetical protein K2X01_03320 [Cyanobacteria bacterium]|nr:hypothetical protein [Cyanobacteriota bacterium]